MTGKFVAAIEGLLETSGFNEDAVEPNDQLLVDNAAALVAKVKGLELPSMLVLSTAHVRTTTAQLLETDEAGVIRHEKGEYGWIIPIIDDKEMSNDPPPNLTDLVAIYALAREVGATWIMLDCDADTIENLESWDW